MTARELSIIRTKLRDVNVEYSALVRAKAGESRFGRMHELKAERQWDHPNGRYCDSSAAVGCRESKRDIETESV